MKKLFIDSEFMSSKFQSKSSGKRHSEINSFWGHSSVLDSLPSVVSSSGLHNRCCLG